MDLNIKDKDGNDIRVVLPEEETSQEPAKEYEAHPEALEKTSYQELEDETKQEEEEDDEEFVLPETIEERIAQNSYVDPESRNIFRSKALEFNKAQLRKNFAIVITIVGILLEIYELLIAHSPNRTYIFIVPPCIVVAIIVFIVYTIKHMKLSKTIVSDYNDTYKKLCLKWTKFGLEEHIDTDSDNVYSNADKTIFVETVQNTEGESYTKISFAKSVPVYKFNNLTLSDGKHGYKYVIESNNGDVSEINILDYIYGKGFNSFYDEYDYPKITERIIKENSIIDTIAEFMES